jgi:hypothetical protein
MILICVIYIGACLATKLKALHEKAALEMPRFKPAEFDDDAFDTTPSTFDDALLGATIRSIPPPYCSTQQYCNPASQTCCLLDTTNKPACFNLVNATCCGVDNTACPNGYVCDPIKGNCAKDSNSTVCQACEAVVTALVNKGCTYACNALPTPLSLVCDFIISEVNLCQKIINWTTHGLSPFTICAEIGLCTGPSCKCSYCTEYQFDRCLSIPSKCPANVDLAADDAAAAEAAAVANVNPFDQLGFCLGDAVSTSICFETMVICCRSVPTRRWAAV